MKRLTVCAFAFLLTALNTSSQAQPISTKPSLFNNFAAVINCSSTELARAFTIAQGQNINLALSTNFSFPGTVSSNLVKYSNLQSLVIKSPFFNNAIFSLSKRTNDDNTITYVGRIIHFDYSDMYELKQDATGNYQLIKIETERVVQTCAHQ
ncbi:MAG: hypothetical protein WCJ85_03265 [Chitinophagaceae bacterium]